VGVGAIEHDPPEKPGPVSDPPLSRPHSAAPSARKQRASLQSFGIRRGAASGRGSDGALQNLPRRDKLFKPARQDMRRDSEIALENTFEPAACPFKGPRATIRDVHQLAGICRAAGDRRNLHVSEGLRAISRSVKNTPTFMSKLIFGGRGAAMPQTKTA